jgi:hypothetical protein
MQQFFSLLSWRLFTAQHDSGVFPPIIRSSMTAVTPSGFTFVLWRQSCCVRGRAGRPARPRTQHDCRHNTKVKPEAVTAVIKLLMMGGKTAETCWAVNKRQDNKLKNCCIRLVIYLNFMMMHALRNLKLPLFNSWEKSSNLRSKKLQSEYTQVYKKLLCHGRYSDPENIGLLLEN